jgi:hypothetical protein
MPLKEKQWVSMLPVELLEFLQGPEEDDFSRITTKTLSVQLRVPALMQK